MPLLVLLLLLLILFGILVQHKVEASSFAEVGSSDGVLKVLDKIDRVAERTKLGDAAPAEHDLVEWIGTSYSFELVDISVSKRHNNETWYRESLAECGFEPNQAVAFDGGDWESVLIIVNQGHFVIKIYRHERLASIDATVSNGSGEKIKDFVGKLRREMSAKTSLARRLPLGIVRQDDLEQLEEDICSGPNALETSTLNKCLQWLRSVTASLFRKSFFDLIDENKEIGAKFFKDSRNNDLCILPRNDLPICLSTRHMASEVFTHLPIAFLKKIENVLVVGGNPWIIKEILKHQLVNLTIIDRDKSFYKYFESCFGDLDLDEKETARVTWSFDENLDFQIQFEEWLEFDFVLFDSRVLENIVIEPAATADQDEDEPTGENSLFARISQNLSPGAVVVVNSILPDMVSANFDQVLTMYHDTPFAPEQMYIVASNGSSLLIPNFSLFEQNQVKTNFLAIEDQNQRFVQYQKLVRRYFQTGMDFMRQAARVFEKVYKREHGQTPRSLSRLIKGTINGEECPAYEFYPCAKEAARDPKTVPYSEWRTTLCGENPHDQPRMKIEVINDSAHPISLHWINDKGELNVLYEKIQEKDRNHLKTSLGHSFAITYAGLPSVRLATFEVTSQLFTHRHVSYCGTTMGIFASREENPRLSQRGYEKTPTPALLT